MTPEEQEAADKVATDKVNAPKVKKKTIDDLKSTDDVVVAFKNPAHVEEDGENKIEKEVVEQHVKYEFWLNIVKDKNGNPKYAAQRGAKLIGYVENGKVIKF